MIENAEEVVYEEKKMEEMEVTFLMDRFGYMRTIDKSAYERNKEAANAENKYVFNCMNTDKICIFTDNGKMHSVKVADIPLVRFRDKGTPADNLSNYDSAPGADVVCGSSCCCERIYVIICNSIVYVQTGSRRGIRCGEEDHRIHQADRGG